MATSVSEESAASVFTFHAKGGLRFFPKRWFFKIHSVTPHYAVIQTHCRENLVYYEQRDVCGRWAGKAVGVAVVQSEDLSGATEGKTVKNLRKTTALE